MAFFNFFDEIGVCILLLALLLLTVFLGSRIKEKKRKIILFAVCLVMTLASEMIFRTIQKHIVEFWMIAIQFVAAPAGLGFGISVFLPQRGEHGKMEMKEEVH